MPITHSGVICHVWTVIIQSHIMKRRIEEWNCLNDVNVYFWYKKWPVQSHPLKALAVSQCSRWAVWTKLIIWLEAPLLCLAPEGGRRGQREPRACAPGCFSHSPSLKVSWATGVSLSLTGDHLAERRTITASLAVIQPSHISMNCSHRKHSSCLLLFAGQRYWSVSKYCIFFLMKLFFS